MRHFVLSRPVAAHPGGMPPPAMRVRLIPPASRLQGPSPRPCSTAAIAVDLPPVAAATNDHLAAATAASACVSSGEAADLRQQAIGEKASEACQYTAPSPRPADPELIAKEDEALRRWNRLAHISPTVAAGAMTPTRRQKLRARL